MKRADDQKNTKSFGEVVNSFHDELYNQNAINGSKRRKVLALIIFYLSCATIFLTIFGQIPLFSSIKVTKVFQIGWVILLLPMFILDYRLLLRSLVNSLILVIPFLIYSLIALGLNVNVFSYQGTSNIFLCLFIFLIGIFYGKYFNINFIKRISFVFVASAIVYGLIVYIQKLRGHIGAEGIYAFDDKNSAGPIFLIAGVLSFFVFDKRKAIHYILKIGIFSAFALLLVIAKCRATILCLPVVLLVIHIFLPKGSTSKILSRSIFPVAMALGITLLFTVPYLYNNIVVHFLMNDKKTIEEAFSGRIQLIQNAISLLKGSKNILIGVGGYYVDCMPISLVVSYGAIGITCLLPVIIIPWYSIIKGRKLLKNPLYFIIEINILLTLYINSVFEGYGFFGPGSKVFFLWLISGYVFFKLIAQPKTAPKLVQIQDKPARFISSIKPKPFSIVLELLLIGGSIGFVASKTLINDTGVTIYNMLPVSRATEAIPVANNMEIDKTFLSDYLDFGKTEKTHYRNTIGELCLDQKIALRTTWPNKKDNPISSHSEVWRLEQYPGTVFSCSIDTLTGVLTANQVEENKQCIVFCDFSSPKTFAKDGPRTYLQISVVKPEDYQFNHTHIDIEPFEESFKLSEIANNNSETNPIKIKKGMTKKLYYDTNYLPRAEYFSFGSFKNPVDGEKYNDASIDKDGIIKLNDTATPGDKFCVRGEINNTKKTFKTQNWIWFEVEDGGQDVSTKIVDLDLTKQCDQYTPYDIKVSFNPEAIDTTFDLKIASNSIKEDDYKIEYDDATNPSKITFFKSGNVTITATSRNNTQQSISKSLVINGNAPKSITCGLDHMWMQVGERKTAKDLDLKITYENGYQKILEDNDVVFNALDEYGSKSRNHRSTSSKNGFYNNDITSVAAVTSGEYSITFIAKDNTNVKYDMKITCSAYSYATYHQLCINIGLIFAFVIISISCSFLLGVQIKNKLIYMLMAASFVLTLSLITITLYPINTCTVICTVVFVGLVFLLSLIRLVFLNNRHIEYIKNVEQ